MRTAAETKRQVRAEMRARLKQIGSVPFRDGSSPALARLENEALWQRARSILGYWATGHEIDIWPALERARGLGKTVALPRYDRNNQLYGAAEAPYDLRDLARDAFGILEPPADSPRVAPNRLDFILVPGLAFDVMGRRLGRGKGFYDRLLAEVNGIKCGVALDEQIVDALPAEPHDVAMNIILTPTRWLIVPPAGS